MKHAELAVDPPPAVAFTAFSDMLPWAVGSGDGRRPLRHWLRKDLAFLTEVNVAVFQQVVLDEMGVLMLFRIRYSLGHLFNNSTLLPTYSKL